MSSVLISIGDCIESLRHLPDKCVHTCVTSPPYFGLRDYGHEGQIGLEATPDAFVARLVEVFREVRRVLRDDGTLWLNLGDSYSAHAAARGGTHQPAETLAGGKSGKAADGANVNRGRHDGYNPTRNAPAIGLKHKDLIGIPWAVATALRDPYYTGKITRERDRVWLAAMIDGEGTICGFHHVRADDGRPRTGVHITITNSSRALLEEAARIWPASRSEHDVPGDGHIGKRPTWRWIVHGIENKTLILREIYPYLIEKKRQAMVAYNLLLLMADAKRLGHSPQRDATRDKRKVLTDLLSSLNQRASVDIPSWLIEPPSAFEPGWFLRQDIIWHKPNPMPESVSDRCTKAHEYIFLLSKSPRYYFDAEAIKEPSVTNDPRRPYTSAGAKQLDGRAEWKSGQRRDGDDFTKRNRRSVWTVTTKPFEGAHFATFPPDLIEPCILAGCPSGGTVLDPFGGSGTTAGVALKHGRRGILCELNPDYVEMMNNRIVSIAGVQPNSISVEARRIGRAFNIWEIC